MTRQDLHNKRRGENLRIRRLCGTEPGHSSAVPKGATRGRHCVERNLLDRKKCPQVHVRCSGSWEKLLLLQSSSAPEGR